MIFDPSVKECREIPVVKNLCSTLETAEYDVRVEVSLRCKNGASENARRAAATLVDEIAGQLAEKV